jgi:adenylate cyclase
LVSKRLDRRLSAILAADVAGYSQLVGADEEGTIGQLKAHRALLFDPKLAEHNGRLVKTTGDGLLAEFASVVDAVRCAVDVQRAMAARNADVAPDRRIEFRIGIHVGDIIVEDDDIFGEGVNGPPARGAGGSRRHLRVGARAGGRRRPARCRFTDDDGSNSEHRPAGPGL